jgi:hypothetical protein
MLRFSGSCEFCKMKKSIIFAFIFVFTTKLPPIFPTGNFQMEKVIIHKYGKKTNRPDAKLKVSFAEDKKYTVADIAGC